MVQRIGGPAVNPPSPRTAAPAAPARPAVPAEPAPRVGWTPRAPASGATAATGDEVVSGARLTASVGVGVASRPADVKVVQARLRELGFPVGQNGVMDLKTAKSLRLVEAIFAGSERATDVKGVLRPGTPFEERLFSDSAPRWTKIPSNGIGWKNVDADHHDFATDHLVKTLNRAGVQYDRDYLSQNPKALAIEANDASKAAGGDTPDHESHETGLDLDLRLPSTDGTRATTRSANYDRAATKAQLRAFAEQPEVEKILIGDRKLLAELKAIDEPWARKIADGGKIHENHFHVDFRPPEL